MRFLRFARQKAAALPFTLMLVAFNVTVVVALLIYATTELNASRNSLGADVARTMALNGVELAGALIAANSTNNAFVSYQNIITNLTSNDTAARLETKIANTIAPDPALHWKREVQNPTALHSGFSASREEGVDLNYASTSDTNSGYIAPRINPTNSNWRNLHENMFRMKWVNIYKGDDSQRTNLIGRFAFWVDDESAKININYSGLSNMYETNTANYQLSGSIRLPITRTNPAALPTVYMRDVSFPMRNWPLFTDLGGVAGINRTNARQILIQRGNPLKYEYVNVPPTPAFERSNAFNPFFSTLEVRTATNSIITNVSEQSQLGFTATMFNREPELSFAKGLARLDMFILDRISSRTTNIAYFATNFINALSNNYPEFIQKYDIPKFAASIVTMYGGPDFSSNVIVPGFQASIPFQTRPRPLVNEIDVRLSANVSTSTNNSTIQTNQNARLDVVVELMTLRGGSTTHSNNNYNNIYGYLSPSNNIWWFPRRTNHSVRVVFDPPLVVNGVAISNQLPPLVADTNRWFADAANNTNSLRIWNQWLAGCFGVMTQSYVFPTVTNSANLNVTNIVWQMPANIVSTLLYTNTDTIQTITNSLPAVGVVTNSLLVDGAEKTVFHLNTQPSRQPAMGIRGDPRFGIHDVFFQYESSSALITNTNKSLLSDESIYRINSSWGSVSVDSNNTVTNISNSANGTGPFSTNYYAEPMSPDITPPYTVFHADRGMPTVLGDSMEQQVTIPINSAEIGEVPITTIKGGRYLSWSTPRFWGDGRTNFGDGVQYPPDWLMLDCVHTAMFPPYTNGVFTSLTNAPLRDVNLEHISYGRININSLKSYFQTPLGSGNRSDTILDTMINYNFTKDFRDYYSTNNVGSTNYGRDWLFLNMSARTNIVNYINEQAISNNNINKPFITPFEFLGGLAGNTNLPNFASIVTDESQSGRFWPAYIPGNGRQSTNTSDRRIESFVRSLHQRITTRGWQYSVFSLGQALQVVEQPLGSGIYKTNIVGESYMQAVWERAPKHDTTTGEIVNASPGGAPPVRMLYLREIR